MYKSILVPVDESEYAFKAVDLAATVASRDNSTLWLLHVVPYAQIPEGMKRWAELEHVDAPEALYESAIADKILAAASERAIKGGAQKMERCVDHGSAARRIIASARDHGADAIIMGSRGLSGIEGLFMGSVAHKVTHGADCTVNTVK